MPRYAGVMSGTSLDGIDVAIAEIVLDAPSPTHPRFSVNLLGTGYVPYLEDLTASLQPLRHGTPISIAEVCRLHYDLAERYADAVRKTAADFGLSLTELAGVGLHGQTVWHAPPSSGASVPATLQLGQPAVLAERLGIPIVSDFRARDIAAGGEGAPLVPFADYVLLASPTETRGMLNLGGIANLTYLPADAALTDVIAFDTGPGNLVIDGVVRALTGEAYDKDGALAAEGVPDLTMLSDLRAHPYFALSPPKSTGAELFNQHYVQRVLERGVHLSTPDLVATVTQLTVETVADAVRRFFPKMPERMIVGGGGGHNQTLLSGLRTALPGIKFVPHEAFGIPSDAKESLAFALLAAATLNQIPSNVPSATGARGPRILGSVTYP